MNIRLLLAALAVVAVASTGAAASVPTVHPTLTLPDCGAQTLSPAAITLACGDGNYGLTQLVWSRWGASSVTTRGIATANDCTPNCAAGHFHSYPMTAAADRVRTCLSGRRQYTRLVIHYGSMRPKGIGATDTWTWACDAPGPGPTLAARASAGRKVAISGRFFSSAAGCADMVTVYNHGGAPALYAQPKLSAKGAFAIVWTAPRPGRVVVAANQACATTATGLRIYEAASAVTVTP
ncbi:MAG: hypothetical protein WCH31_03090 [Actinomycetes bacterium]